MLIGSGPGRSAIRRTGPSATTGRMGAQSEQSHYKDRRTQPQQQSQPPNFQNRARN